MSDQTQDGAPTYWLSAVDPNVFPSGAALPAEAEAVVVGGGLMGVATAYWLARRGLDVLLVEARRLSWGATGRNAGLMLAGTSPLEDPALTRAVLAEEGIEAEYVTPGHLALASSEEVWGRILAEVARRGRDAPPLHALDVRGCEELLGMRLAGGVRGGRWYPGGAAIHSTRFVYGLARAAARRGARLAPLTRARGVRRAAGGRAVVETDRGDVSARHVVYACNARIGELVPEFGRVLTPVRGQVLSTRPLPRMFRPGLALDWGTVYWRQLADGTIILGGAPEGTGGREVGCEEVVNDRVQGGLEAFLPRVFPEFPPFEVSQRWAGIMDCSRDGRPLVGPLPGRPHEWVAVGFNGHGMPAGLGVGKFIAEAVATGRPPEALEPYAPARFEELLPARTGGGGRTSAG